MRSSALPTVLVDFESFFIERIDLASGKFYLAIRPYFLKLFGNDLQSKSLRIVFFSKYKMGNSTSYPDKKKLSLFGGGFYLDDIIDLFKSAFPNTFPFACLDDFSARLLDCSYLNITSDITPEQLKRALVISGYKSILDAASVAHKHNHPTLYISYSTLMPGELSRTDRNHVRTKILDKKIANGTFLLSIDIDDTLFWRGIINHYIVGLTEEHVALSKICGLNAKITLTTARISDEKERQKRHLRCLETNSFILSKAYSESQYDYACDILKTFVETLKIQMPEESFALSYNDDIHFLGHLDGTQTVWGQSKAFFLLEKLILDPLLHIAHVDDSLEEKEFFDLLNRYRSGNIYLETLITEISKHNYGDPTALNKIITMLRTTDREAIFNAIDRLDFVQAYPDGTLTEKETLKDQKVIETWLLGPLPPTPPLVSTNSFAFSAAPAAQVSEIPLNPPQGHQNGM